MEDYVVSSIFGLSGLILSASFDKVIVEQFGNMCLPNCNLLMRRFQGYRGPRLLITEILKLLREKARQSVEEFNMSRN